MTKSPNLQLPQRPPRTGSGAAVGLILALVLILLVLQVLVVMTLPKHNRPAGPASYRLLTPDDQRTLALRLEDKNLPQAAVSAWEAYLQEAALTGAEAAKVMLQIGKLKQDSADYDGAIHEYYRAEKLLERQGVQDEDLSRTITVRVRECFRALGQYGDLSREMAERASPDTGDTSLAGRQVVAEIGGDKITVADFDRIVAAQVELAVRSQWGLTPEEADAARQRAYERLADPQAKARHLQQIVMTRVIANEARKQNLEESAGFRERLVATADAMLADTLIGEEISKRATVTEADIRRYYEANKDRYAEPATTRVARILCGTQEEAQALLERARAGEDFAELARANSSDAQTRDSGGELPRPVSEQGDQVPGIGSDVELHGRIWAAAPGDLLAEPYRSAAGWEVIKVLDRTARKERPLDEVRDRVEYDTRLARRQEVSEQYITELMKSAGVKVYPEAFSLGGSEAKPEAQSP